LMGMPGGDCVNEFGNPGKFECGPNPNDVFCVDPENPPPWYPPPWYPPPWHQEG
jgi:hypothetical protein